MQKSKQKPNDQDDQIRIVIKLLKLITVSNSDSKTIINYIQNFKIDINTYLPTMTGNGNTLIPLIYYCCSNPSLSELFLYLIDKKVNLNVQIISDDPSQQIELLYYSHEQYIPLLVENGCQLNPLKTSEMFEKLLIGGYIKKLITLYNCKVIKKEQLILVLQKRGTIFRVLDKLYEHVYSFSQKINNITKFNEVYEELLGHYINVFKLFFKNGVNVNQIENGESFVQKVLNTYFIPLIQFVLDRHPNLDSEEFLHYSNFGLLNRQVMKFIYNDNNYEFIEKYMRDKLLPKKINIKKNVIKKVVQLEL